MSIISYKNSSNLDKITEKYEYSYNKNSDITKEKLYNNYTEDTKTDKTKDYTYDNLGRLTSVKVTNNLTQNESNTSYTYDKIGNRLSKTKGSMEEKYSYNDLNELENIKNASDTIIKSYTYDANGNTTKETAGNEVIDYKYDIDNQMTSYTKTVGENETLRQTNEYNSDGQRITKTVAEGENSNTTKYNYDRGNLLYTTNGSNDLTSSNMLDESGSFIGTFRFNESTPRYYLYTNDMGSSVMNVLKENGESAISYDFDEFGETSIASGDNNFYNEVCYNSGIYDKETGEYYLNARYYEPNNGRFVTADTYRGNFDEPSSLHLYAYCENDPINNFDPSGNAKLKKWVIFVIRGLVGYRGSTYRALAKSAISSMGSKYLSTKGYSLSNAFFKHSIWGKGSGIGNNTRNLLGKKLWESSFLKKKIFSRAKLASRRNKNSFKSSKAESHNFSSGDLHYAIGHCSYKTYGKKMNGRYWKTKLLVWDIYDFTELRTTGGLTFSNMSNNLGLAMYSTGLLDEFSWKVKITKYIKV